MSIKYVEGEVPQFTYISCGKRHMLAIDSEGMVYGTGDNSFRQLGIPNFDKLLSLKPLSDLSCKASKVAAGSEHSLLLS